MEEDRDDWPSLLWIMYLRERAQRQARAKRAQRRCWSGERAHERKERCWSGALASLAARSHARHGALEDSGGAHRERGAVALVHIQPLPGGLGAVERHARVVNERVEHANGVGAATHAGDDGVRELVLLRRHRGLDLVANHALEVAHDGRKRVRADGAANELQRVSVSASALVTGTRRGD